MREFGTTASLVLFFAALLQFAGVQTAGSQQVVIEEPWARASIGSKRPGTVFMIIRNKGAVSDVLSAVETQQAARAEVHRTRIVDGIASMKPAGALKLPGKGEIRLTPGGFHIMLMQLKAPLVKGNILPLSLIFERVGRVDVKVPVLSVGASGPEK